MKILFVVNVDWFFLSHRLPIALAARDAGFDVYVAAADTGKAEEIKSYGLNFISLHFSRKGTNLFSEISLLPKVYKLYSRLDPDIVHHVTIKPVLFGSLVALFKKNINVVNAITGLGFVFSNDKKALSLKTLIKWLYKLVLSNPRNCTVFQNIEDQRYFIRNRFIRESKTVLIKGSGVNCSKFLPQYESDDPPIVILASRMIWDKGINEFVECAKIVKAKRPETRFVLAGKPDQGNPNTVPSEQLKSWSGEGIVEWWGYCENMPTILQRSAVVTLPTFYPEGVPKILIEAAAAGKPLVTTDQPGCRDIVRDGINGKLVPPKDSSALAEAIIQLLEDPELAEKYGRKGRKIVESEFSVEIVVSKTMEVYRKLLGSNWPENNINGRIRIEQR